MKMPLVTKVIRSYYNNKQQTTNNSIVGLSPQQALAPGFIGRVERSSHGISAVEILRR